MRNFIIEPDKVVYKYTIQIQPSLSVITIGAVHFICNSIVI